MKTVADMNLLAGQTEKITMSDLRRQPGEVIKQVQMGKVFTITKAGKAVAVLSKPEPSGAALTTQIGWSRKRDELIAPPK